MKTCADCIHCDVCPKESYATDINPYIDFSRRNDVDESCVDFKDKNKCIELPCLPGDIVYRLDYSLPLCFMEPERMIIRKVFVEKNGLLIFDCEDCFAFRGADLGKDSVFLTKEEAEEKLEEIIAEARKNK